MGFPGSSDDVGKESVCNVGDLGSTSGKESVCNAGNTVDSVCGFDPCVRRIPWKRKWQPIPVFLPGKSQGLRSLVGCIPWGRIELDMSEATECKCFKG